MLSPNIRPAVLQARERLQQGREKLQTLHRDGAPGVQVCTYLTDLLDEAVLDLYQTALEDTAPHWQSQIALAPHGGYGRRDVAPYSDVDLMLLHSPELSEADIQPLARRLQQDICDAGLDLGFSVRTPAQACSMAMKDPVIFTSLTESRFLAGGVRLFSRFLHNLRRDAQRKRRALTAALLESRRQERLKYGETVYLLTPNIKRSQGGLRDIQLVRWIGFAYHGETDLRVLERMDAISRDERRRLDKAREFFLWLRNELHFHASKAQDVVDRQEQVRLAEFGDYQGESGLFPAEQLMRDYFRHACDVQNAAEHFASTLQGESLWKKSWSYLLSHQMEGDFRVGPASIWATRQGREKLQQNPTEVLRMMDLANRHQKKICLNSWDVIRQAQRDIEITPTPEFAKRFLSLLSHPGTLARWLRSLHDLRMLDGLIVGLAHARCLLQFNNYHQYTVDEHSFRAVDEAVGFLNRSDSLGRAYRRVKNKRLLHLALLLHDLGKGHNEDHSVLGARYAAETAQRLGLETQEAETLEFLVRRHLTMSHLVERRDIHDPQVIFDFAVQVGSPEVLQMLYVLTCADVSAVGPGKLTRWKLGLLTELYRSTRRQLAVDDPIRGEDPHLEKRRGELRRILGEERLQDCWWRREIAALPPAFLVGAPPEQLIEELQTLRKQPPGAIGVWSRYLPKRKAVEYVVGYSRSLRSRAFHRITGALSSKRQQILSAEIHTLACGMVMNRFYVHDQNFEEEPPTERLREVEEMIRRTVEQQEEKVLTFTPVWGGSGELSPDLQHLPTKVQADNNTSDQYTIFELFAHDRLGLLYTVARTLYNLELIVHRAKIGAHLDQVVDAFYVTDRQGRKLANGRELAAVRQQLRQKVEEFEQL